MRITVVSMLAAAAVFCLVYVGTAEGAVSDHAAGTVDEELVPATAAAGPAAAGPGDPSTTLTFTVTSGALSMSVPVSADLGSGAPGTVISAAIGPNTVTDNRALASASWTVTAAETDFANGAFTIPATASTYTPGVITTTGTITVNPTDITLSNSPQTVVTGSAGVGDNTASWSPTVAVTIPPAAVGGLYTGTLTQSVS